MFGAEGERPPTFGCEVVRAGDTVTVRLQGELDLVSTERADGILAAALAGGPYRRLVLDLRELTFMDSTGLRLLLHWDAASRADGFRVEIVRGPDHVQRLLELTGLERHFTFVEPD